MIEAVFFSGEGGLVGFEVKGHAGYAEEGGDIVCAAVSAVLIGAVNGLESVVGVLPDVSQSGGSGGYLKAELPDNLDAQKARDARLVLAVARQAVEDIVAQYPRYVRIISRNRR